MKNLFFVTMIKKDVEKTISALEVAFLEIQRVLRQNDIKLVLARRITVLKCYEYRSR